jgi:cation diffusion facilitator family transporter
MSRMELLDKGERTAKIGLVVVFLIGIAKGIVGLLSGSVAVIAQTVDSLTDLFSLITVFIGLRLSKRPPTERFPYGYYKAETIVSLIVAILLIFTGGEIVRRSIQQILDPSPLLMSKVIIIIVGASIPILYWISEYTREVGEDINSQSLKNQAADFKADVYASILVLVGVGSGLVGYPSIEGIMGVIISVFILRMGLKLAWNSLLGLMDAVEDPDQMLKIKEIAEGTRGVRKAYDIRCRKTGPFCMGEITIGVERKLSVDQAHQLSERVEMRIKKEIPEIESIVTHIEPIEETEYIISIPVKEDKGLESHTSQHFGEAPYFIFVRYSDNQIIEWKTKKNPSLDMEKRRGVAITEMIQDEEATTVLTGNIGEGPFHILRDSFVQIYHLPEEMSVEGAVRKFMNNIFSRYRDPSESESFDI